MRVRGPAVAAAAVLLLIAPILAFAQDATWVISNTKTFTSPSRSGVTFTHVAHQQLEGVTCLTCHHVYKDGKNVLDPATLKPGDASLKCATCHTRPADLEQRYHQQCITCHDTAPARFGVTGPRACGECHLQAR